MLEWIAQNIGTISVGAVLLLIFGSIIFFMIKNKKAGKSSCSCGSCGSCPMSDKCHEKK